MHIDLRRTKTEIVHLVVRDEYLTPLACGSVPVGWIDGASAAGATLFLASPCREHRPPDVPTKA